MYHPTLQIPHHLTLQIPHHIDWIHRFRTTLIGFSTVVGRFCVIGVDLRIL